MRAVMNPDYLQYVNGGWRVRMKVPEPLWPLAGGRQTLTWPTGIKAPKDDKAALAKARDVSRRTIHEFKAQIDVWQRVLRLGVDAAPIRARYAADAEAAERRAQFARQLSDEQLAEIEALSARFRRLRMAQTDPAKPVDSEGVIQAWIAERKADNDPPKPKAIRNKRSKLARLFGFVQGKKLPPRLSDKEIEALLKSGNIRAIAAENLKAYRLYLLDEGIAFDHLADIKALFAVAKRADFVQVNPADDIPLPTKKSGKRPPFSDADARAILIAARNSDDPVIRWSNWLAAFTTAINSEILEAQSSEFYQLPNGQWVWDMRGRVLKTGSRPRMMSLHPAIIREGFLAHLATRQGRNLFDGNTASNTNKLNDFIHGLGITRSFYSWRHRTIHWLDHRVDAKLNPAMSRYVAGHAASDIHEAFYNHHAELVGELAEEFDHIVKAIEALKDPTPSDVVREAAQ